MTPAQIHDVVSALRPGYWWITFPFEGGMQNRIVEIYFDDSWGLSVYGQGALDEYIRTTNATFVAPVADPPSAIPWSAKTRRSIVKRILENEGERPGSRERFFNLLAEPEAVTPEARAILEHESFSPKTPDELSLIKIWCEYKFFVGNPQEGYLRTELGESFLNLLNEKKPRRKRA